ncbi:hypothetical protein CLCR_10951 [Cladophialophora carrionii]|uniref:D-isomer specific 2-hydroxyacid dehydrogenase catalytic domain-containing protein n=1 Tax=Cladophialophora carrionii TaxID=86049 RepID=A0A1C1CXR4_9EURO|nr:hypothetical protein CLCR_10951 [Cladophialophora carrionii]
MEPWDNDIVSLLPDSHNIYTSVGAGYDWMDILLLTERGILYCNSGPACPLAVADAALNLVISVFRHFTLAQLGAKTGDPQTWSRTRCLTAGGSVESTIGVEQLCIENMNSVFSTRKVVTPVNPEALLK